MGDARRRKIWDEAVALTIADWKEVNPIMELKIIFIGGLILIGQYEDEILQKPRVVISGQDSQGREVMGLKALVGTPDKIEQLNPALRHLMYDVKDESLINLYIQATTGIVPARDLSNVRPIKGGNNPGGVVA